MRTRHQRLIGIDGASLLRAAAREMDALGKRNARIAEVDERSHTYAPITDIYYFEKKLESGLWEAGTIEDIGGQGRVMVQRSLQENLVPAMTLGVIAHLVRGGVFNEFEPAKRHVLDACRFVCAGRVDV